MSGISIIRLANTFELAATTLYLHGYGMQSSSTAGEYGIRRYGCATDPDG